VQPDCTPVDFDGTRLWRDFDSAQTRAISGAYSRRHSGCSSVRMPLKPNGKTCRVREQIIEDSASGLTLQFECDDGRLRVVIAGAPLKLGNREILFDEGGREAGAGTLVGEFRKPSWLKAV
jgi:hypothetical protein